MLIGKNMAVFIDVTPLHNTFTLEIFFRQLA